MLTGVHCSLGLLTGVCSKRMTSAITRVHSHTSNRKSAVKSKIDYERKVVHRSVLDNPYEIAWPTVPLNVQNMILARITDLLSGIGEYMINRKLAGRKRKRKAGKSTAIKVSRTNESMNTGGELDADYITLTFQDELLDSADQPSADDSSLDPPSAPSLLSHVLLGINEVTKRLETQIDHAKNSSASLPDDSADLAPICMVLVCVDDLATPMLVAHLPQLIAAYNSVGPHKLKLVPLPRGAESTLTNSLGLRRTSAIAFEDCKEIDLIRASLDSVPDLIAPWLTPSLLHNAGVMSQSYEVTHVKQLRTTAPRNMKAAKESRASGVAEAKLRKKSVAGS